MLGFNKLGLFSPILPSAPWAEREKKEEMSCV